MKLLNVSLIEVLKVNLPIINEYTNNAVSYAHLDVYKRQLLNRYTTINFSCNTWIPIKLI